MAAGLFVYGLLTGFVMKWLIVHGDRRTRP
jgi:hypothetical protein